MLNLTCTFCRQPINLGDGDLALIMQETRNQRRKSYLITCPKCRRGNKAPMRRIEQAYRLAGSPPPPAEPAAAEEPVEQESAPDTAAAADDEAS